MRIAHGSLRGRSCEGVQLGGVSGIRMAEHQTNRHMHRSLVNLTR
jgi:hypothetical protein